MSTHSFLSPSFGKIGYNCPASALRTFQVRQRMELIREIGPEFYGLTNETSIDRFNLIIKDDNSMALEGTALHEIFEKCLLEGVNDKSKINKIIQSYDDISESTKNDDYIIDVFHKVVTSQLKTIADADFVGVEHKVNVKGFPQGGTVDLIFTKGDKLYIRDLKTGFNEVHSKNNHQLFTYAVGVLDEFGWDKFNEIELGIIGIRWSSNSNVVKVKDVENFKTDIMFPAFMEAYSINPKARAGDWCQYCDGKIHCKQWQDKFNNLVNNEVFVNEDMTDLSNDELVELYATFKASENLIKFQLNTEIMLRMQGFDPVNGVTTVSKTRDVINVPEDELVEKLSKKVPKSKLYNRTLKTPKQLRALIGEDEELEGMIDTLNNKPYLVLK